MLKVKQLIPPIDTIFLKRFILLLAFLVLSFPSAILAAHPCEKATRDLRGDMNVVASRGGLWSLMEQRGLKENSVLGMRADSKLARAVGQFEALCEGEKKPGKQLYQAISNLLGEARTIFNPRSSEEDVAKLIENLNKKLDALLKKMG